MKIENGKLIGPGVEYAPTTKKNSGVNNKKYIVVHYTAGSSYENDVKTLSTSTSSQVSCHIVISREGKITQIGNFDDRQWHAGQSEWKGTKSLNAHSIGIELTNPGFLTPTADPDIYTAHFGKNYSLSKDKLVLAKNKNVGSATYGWLPYTPEQIAALELVVSTLNSTYRSIEEVVGHEQISPGRKVDPGIGIILSHELLNKLNGKGSGEASNAPEPPKNTIHVDVGNLPPDAAKEVVDKAKPVDDGIKWVKRRVIAQNGLRIRATRSTSGTILGSLPYNTKIETLWQPSGWLQLKQGGFVATRYTEVI